MLPHMTRSPAPPPRPPRAVAGTPAPAAAPADAPVRVLRQFRIIFNAVKTHFQQVERRAGASGTQVWALHVISQQPGLGVSGLARALDVRQPTASIFVKALAQQQLIEIRREGSDRRAVQLHLTPAGRKLLRKAPGPFAGVLPQALAELDEATLLRIEVDLAALIRQLKADEQAAGVPLGSP